MVDVIDRVAPARSAEELDNFQQIFSSQDEFLTFLKHFEREILQIRLYARRHPHIDRAYACAVREYVDFIESYRTLAQNHLLDYPLTVKKYDRPDFVVVEDDKQYGLEATTASEQIYEQWLVQNVGRPRKQTYNNGAFFAHTAESYAVELIKYAIERKSWRTMYYKHNSGCHIQQLLMRLKCHHLPDLNELTTLLRCHLNDFKPMLDFRRILIVTHSRRMVVIHPGEDGIRSLVLM